MKHDSRRIFQSYWYQSEASLAASATLIGDNLMAHVAIACRKCG
jgi:hypothetical protein